MDNDRGKKGEREGENWTVTEGRKGEGGDNWTVGNGKVGREGED